MTTAKNPTDICGLEYDWLATDADGHVAFFSTAGGGYAPDEFLSDTDLHDAAIEAILALPALTDARFAPSLPPGHQNTWKLMAERGVFAFDSDPHGGPYRLVSAPQQPARASDLPEAVVRAATRFVLAHLRFAHTSELPAAALQHSRLLP
jgi:hypothetical protein